MGGSGHGAAEPDWAGHEARAGHLVNVPRRHDWVRSGQDGAAMRAWTESVHGAPADVAASLLLLLIRRARVWGPDGHDLMWGLEEVRARRRQLVVSAADAAWAVRLAAGMPDGYGSLGVMEAAAALAVWCDQPGDPGLQEAVEALVAAVDAHDAMLARDRAKIRKRLLSLRPAAPAGGPLDTTMIRPGDGWSAAVLEQAGRWPGEADGANLLLAHLAAAAGSKPSRKWQERAVALLRDPGAEEMLRILVESAATAEVVMVRRYDRELPYLVSEANKDLLRAAFWAAGALAAEWAVPALHAAGGRSAWGASLAANGYVASAMIPNACVYGLGLIGSEPAIAGLLDLRRRVKHAGFHKQIDAALAAAAARTGLSLGELAERLVPDAGLDGQGERQIAVDGAVVASVSIGDGWRVGVRWRETTARSAQNSDDAARQVRTAVKEVRTALAAERRRLEGLLAEERSWAVADWRRWYLGHPVTGALTRGLIWSFSTGVTGIPADGDRLAGADGEQVIPAEATVRLWHPARADTAQVGRWRDYLVAAGRAQPFKQAFREVYLITPAELETRLYSNRFAAHVPIPVGLRAVQGARLGGQLPRPVRRGLRGTGPAGLSRSRADRVLRPLSGRRRPVRVPGQPVHHRPGGLLPHRRPPPGPGPAGGGPGTGVRRGHARRGPVRLGRLDRAGPAVGRPRREPAPGLLAGAFVRRTDADRGHPARGAGPAGTEAEDRPPPGTRRPVPARPGAAQRLQDPHRQRKRAHRAR